MSTPFPIPTGLRPSAQGCRAREATLENVFHNFPQPQRGCINRSRDGGLNPFRVDEFSGRYPRVARPSQPWAECCYPVGVKESRALVAMLEPYKGRMFETLQSVNMNCSIRQMNRHGIHVVRGKLWPCASTATWELARMNLAIRGIDANLGPRNADSFRTDLHPDLKADLVPVRKDLANPPFSMSDWGGENLRQDVRWKFGMPHVNNANYAWIQHFIHHISPVIVAGFVMAKTARSAHSCPMKITEDVRKYATEQSIAEEEALKNGMEEKSKEFLEKGAEV